MTISGTNFTGATKVLFGTTPAASFAVGSASSITAYPQPRTGTVNVTVAVAALRPRRSTRSPRPIRSYTQS